MNIEDKIKKYTAQFEQCAYDMERMEEIHTDSKNKVKKYEKGENLRYTKEAKFCAKVAAYKQKETEYLKALDVKLKELGARSEL